MSSNMNAGSIAFGNLKFVGDLDKKQKTDENQSVMRWLKEKMES